MNERIENLMYRAGLTAQGCWDEMDSYMHEAIEKFAELIIKDKDEHIKWLEDRLAHQTEQTEKAMEMAHKLMGKLK
jgi:hypothetical protein